MQYTKDVELGGRTFTIQHFMPTKGIKVLTRLTKLVGQPFAEMAGGVDQDVTKILPKAVESLLSRMDEDEVESLIKDLIGSCFIGPRQIKDSLFETTFQGSLGDMFKLCFEVVDFQFSDFLKDLIAKSGSLVAVKKGSSAQST